MRKIGLALAGLLVIAGSMASAQEDGRVTIVGDDPDALRALVERLVSPFNPFRDTGTTLYLGALPEDILFEVTIPEDAELLGTVVGTSDVGDNAIIYFNTAQSGDEVIAFYRDTLGTTFEEREQPGMSGGFVGGPTGLSAMFCSDDYAFIGVYVEEISRTEVTVQVQEDITFSPCASSMDGTSIPYEIIPWIEQPRGVRILSSGGGGSSASSLNTTATVQGDIRADALASGYNAQLAAAGWTLVNEASVEGVATSHWTFADEDGDPWTGTLIVTETPIGSERLLALLQIDLRRE